MITFYVDKNRAVPGLAYIPLLYPFWGIETNKNTPYPNNVFKKYGFDPAYYRLSSHIEESDYILLAHNYWHLYGKRDDYINDLVLLSQKHKKPILIDARSDIEKKVSVPDSVVLKIAQFRFKKSSEEIIVPTYSDDLLEHYENGALTVRDKNKVPRVGFAGWAHLPLTLRLRTHIKELPITFRGLFDARYKAMHKGVLFREKAILHLSQSSEVVTSFLARPTYSGHLETVTGDAEAVRQEFVNNILSSDYCLDVRGDANASCRFYEILSLGRIPLFIDTERVMPLEDRINYDEFCLRVSWRDVPRLGQIVKDFNDAISGEDFQKMQKQAREVFSTMLRIDRFTPYLMEELKRRVKNFHS
jgi:hypothetical protein